jgi:hypothetical protein
MQMPRAPTSPCKGEVDSICFAGDPDQVGGRRPPPFRGRYYGVCCTAEYTSDSPARTGNAPEPPERAVSTAPGEGHDAPRTLAGATILQINRRHPVSLRCVLVD